MMADYEIVRRSAIEGKAGEHRLASGVADEADIILFVGSRDPLHRDIRRHPLTRQFPDRVVLYDSSDWVIPFLPGIYPSIDLNRFRPGRIWSGFYLRWSNSTTIQFTDPETEPRFLYGFVGSVETHPVRKRVLALGRPDALLRDTTAEPGRGYDQAPEVYESYRSRYGSDLALLRFVLCPRGVGPNSMRIFEAMKAGRVPVIISDQWVEPDGPDWKSFSLRIAEKDVERLPGMLESISERSAAMGRAARAAWEAWFSPEVAFQILAGRAGRLCGGSRTVEWVERRRAEVQVLRWHSVRHFVLGPIVRDLRQRSRRRHGRRSSDLART